MDKSKRIDLLEDKLNSIKKKYFSLGREIETLSRTLSGLKQEKGTTVPSREKSNEAQEFIAKPTKEKKPTQKFQLEAFIGGNLINKIGIIAIVAGFGFLISFAIENELLSPLIRLILSLSSGFILIGFAYRLMKKYRNFSGVLFGGGIAVLYFSVYIAHDFYNFIPSWITILFMLLLTIITAGIASWQNTEAIGMYGFVGAYAIPFLFGLHSADNLSFIFYVTIINLGIIFLSYFKDWKILYYTSFGLSWIIFMVWYGSTSPDKPGTTITVGFLTFFFVSFYAIFLLYKLVKEEKFHAGDIFFLLLNSFIFYGVGYHLFEHSKLEEYLGLFTLGNAILHGFALFLILRARGVEKGLYLLIAGLVMLFITISIPVQLTGKWVTLLWTGEFVLLYLIGQKSHTKFYINFSLVLLLLAFASLFIDWTTAYQPFSFPDYTGKPIIFNTTLLLSLFFILGTGFITYYKRFFTSNTLIPGAPHAIIPVLFVASIYLIFRFELVNSFAKLYQESIIPGDFGNIGDSRLIELKKIWTFIYSTCFFAVLSLLYINRGKTPNRLLMGVMLILVVSFFLVKIPALNDLRQLYLDKEMASYYPRGATLIAIRYFSYIFFGMLVYTFSRLRKKASLKKSSEILSEVLLHVALLVFIIQEMINLSRFNENNEWIFQRLGISIIMGIYAVALLYRGIKKPDKVSRVQAILLFLVTILKILLFDLSGLAEGGKTIVLIITGVFLLIASFLYQKYKHLLFDEDGS